MEILDEVEFSCVVLRAVRQCLRHSNDRYEYHCYKMLVFGRAASLDKRMAHL